MENASKFLIIAGGILIGIIVLSIFVYEMSFTIQTAKKIEEEMALTQTLKFNAQFTVYLGKKLTPQEVATVYNYVQEWNYGGEGHPNDLVEIKYKGSFEGETLAHFMQNNRENTSEKFLLNYTKFKDDSSTPKCYFECKDIEFNGNEGRVSSITIYVKEY